MKQLYVCGSKNEDRFKEMRKIIFHYAHEHPKYFTKQLPNGRIYQALAVLLTKEEQELVRRDISLIDIPESCRRRM